MKLKSTEISCDALILLLTSTLKEHADYENTVMDQRAWLQKSIVTVVAKTHAKIDIETCSNAIDQKRNDLL